MPKKARSKKTQNRRITFKLEASEAKEAILVGDFNSWDPFAHQMEEQAPGVFTTRVRTFSGVHSYFYLVDGRRILDSLNPNFASDYEGFEVSRFLMP